MAAHCRNRLLPGLLLMALVSGPTHAASDDIVVMTSGAFAPAYLTLASTFADASGNRMITAATAMGIGPESIPNRLAAGEAVDVVIVASDALEQLTADGRIVPGSRLDLARSSIALAVRKGAPHPDISSVEALTRSFLAAKSVAYSVSVSGTYLVQELLPRLGIADAMRGKTRRIEGERVGAVVARGDAEIAFQQMSELSAIPGLEIVGPLPGDTQRVTVFSAGIGAKASHLDAARAFLAFLASPAAQPAIEASGLESLRSR